MNIFDILKQDYKADDRRLREIDEETADDQLYVVPPIRQDAYGFVNSEPYTHNDAGQAVYFCCFYKAARYYAVYATLKEWDTRALWANLPTTPLEPAAGSVNS